VTTYTIRVTRTGKDAVRLGGFGTIDDAQQAVRQKMDYHRDCASGAQIIRRRSLPDGSVSKDIVWSV
jgi:hypothetical protein